MKPLFKFAAGLILLSVALFAYFYTTDEKVTVKSDVLAEIKLYEGPHLIHRNDDSTIISGVAKQGKMTLSVETLKDPKQVTVYKPGEQPVNFTVPLKKQVSNPAVSYDKPEKIFAISDVEGNFNTVTGLLKQHQVINDELRWQFGKGHLVVIGDVFDRGNHVTELLWLLYRLEGEAKAQGGMVHMLLGNHEMMVMQNDLRYVEPKYITFEELLKKHNGMTTVDLFRENTELGRWLRSKNVIEKIGDILFAHGGMSIEMVNHQLSLEKINQTMRAAIDTPKAKRNELEKLLFGRNGPMWYRGYFMPIPNSPMINDEELDKVLAFYGAKAVAVGHTIVPKPELKFGGKVIAVDVKHPADHLITIPPRISYGVLIKGEQVFVVDETGRKTAL